MLPMIITVFAKFLPEYLICTLNSWSYANVNYLETILNGFLFFFYLRYMQEFSIWFAFIIKPTPPPRFWFCTVELHFEIGERAVSCHSDLLQSCEFQSMLIILVLMPRNVYILDRWVSFIVHIYTWMLQWYFWVLKM